MSRAYSMNRTLRGLLVICALSGDAFAQAGAAPYEYRPFIDRSKPQDYAKPRSGAYLGIGVDNLDAAQYEAAGTDHDWGAGAGPGGGMLISFVDPQSEAFEKGILWGDILLSVEGLTRRFGGLVAERKRSIRFRISIWRCRRCRLENRPN